MNMDGVIAGRLIRSNYNQHKTGDSGTLFLTLVKDRGSYYKDGKRQEIPADFLSFQLFINESNQGVMNQKDFLENLAKDNSFVEIMYQLKSYRKTTSNGQKETIQYLKLVDFAPLESRREREERQQVKQETPDSTETNSHESTEESPETNGETDEQPATTVTPDPTDVTNGFDPEQAGSFVEEQAKDHIVTDEPLTTSDGLYGNPFK